MGTDKAKKVIIDCDPGCDDALALMYACGSPELEVLTVTTCCGNADIETTSTNAAAIIDLIGASKIPVVSGARKPLRVPLETSVVHGTSGLGDLKLRAHHSVSSGAAEKICGLARMFPNQVTLIALGPLTNLAQAYRTDPRGFRSLSEIVILGGSVSAPGNKGAVAEFNFYVDPDAASVVLQSGVPIKLIVLDVCYSVALQRRDFDVVKNRLFRALLGRLLNPYMKANWKEEGIRGAIMYDPLAVYSALHGVKLRTQLYRGAIETNGHLTRGMLVIDRRARTKAKPNIAVVERINRESFKRSFFRALNRISIDEKVVRG